MGLNHPCLPSIAMNFHWFLDSPAWKSVEWLTDYFTPGMAITLSLLSILMLIASLILTPWLLIRIPADYFLLEKPHLWTRLKHSSPGFRFILLIKNALGVLCIGAGLLMLVLPGQGLLTILAGIFLLDFHGKKELERRLISRPKVLKTINWLRSRSGRPELDLGDLDSSTS